MNPRRHANVVNVDEVESLGRGKGRFGVSARRQGKPAGAQAIGINGRRLSGLEEVPVYRHGRSHHLARGHVGAQ